MGSNQSHRKAVTTPEGKVKALVKRLFAVAFPNSYRFMPVQYGMGAPSVDLLFCIEGLFVAVETKAPDKQLTTRQAGTLAQIGMAGGMIFVVRDEEDCLRAIRCIVQKRKRCH
jgi:hypothetical protein